MKNTWKLKLRMILTSVVMFTIVYFLIMLVGLYLGVSSWKLYFGASFVGLCTYEWPFPARNRPRSKNCGADYLSNAHRAPFGPPRKDRFV